MAKRKVAQPEATPTNSAGGMLDEVLSRLLTVESQLRVLAGASQAIEQGVWTSLAAADLATALDALGDDVGDLAGEADRVLLACRAGRYAEKEVANG
jgi:hypothetical protein